ncbi:hypothetical protein D3C72_1218790 [compost metagenome]
MLQAGLRSATAIFFTLRLSLLASRPDWAAGGTVTELCRLAAPSALFAYRRRRRGPVLSRSPGHPGPDGDRAQRRVRPNGPTTKIRPLCAAEHKALSWSGAVLSRRCSIPGISRLADGFPAITKLRSMAAKEGEMIWSAKSAHIRIASRWAAFNVKHFADSLEFRGLGWSEHYIAAQSITPWSAS